MMGRQEHGQGCLFYQIDLEERIPADHLLRGSRIPSTSAALARTLRRSTATPDARRLIRS